MSFWKPGESAPRKGPSLIDIDDDVNFPVAHKNRERLPINNVKLQFLWALETHNVVVLLGSTGCGKSTQLPQFLDRAGWTNEGHSVCIALPRRVAAVTIATRVAKEMRVDLGAEVGYQIRFDNKCSEITRVRFVTDALLLREMLRDPLLTKYSVVVMDDAHERSLSTDLLFGLLRKILLQRPHFRVVVCSATLDAEAYIKFFTRTPMETARLTAPGKNLKARPVPSEIKGTALEQEWKDCFGGVKTAEDEAKQAALAAASAISGQPSRTNTGEGSVPADVICLSVEGRAHPVSIRYLSEPTKNYIDDCIRAVLEIHQRAPPGDILVFLTGQEEIDHVVDTLNNDESCSKKASNMLYPLPLYSVLPLHRQLKVFERAPHGARKVVVSTDLAESSVTIEGIRYIIDSCLVKTKAYDPVTGIDHLHVTPASQAALKQRAGRAGRTQRGDCYRLITESTFHALPPMRVPDLLRSDLSGALLQLKCLGVNQLATFQWVTPPTVEAMSMGLETLFALEIIDMDGQLTKDGFRIADLPLPPPLARFLLVSEEFECLDEALTICAMLSVHTPWLPPGGGRNGQNTASRLQACKESLGVHEGDLVTLLNVYRQFDFYEEEDRDWANRHMINARVVKRAQQIRNQLVRHMNVNEDNIDACDDVQQVCRAICKALFMNAAQQRLDHYVNVRSAAESSHPTPLYAGDQTIITTKKQPEWIVYLTAEASGEYAYVHNVTVIESGWLTELAPHFYKQTSARELQEIEEEKHEEVEASAPSKKQKTDSGPVRPMFKSRQDRAGAGGVKRRGVAFGTSRR